jgi:hypothetical protein
MALLILEINKKVLENLHVGIKTVIPVNY